MIKVSYIGKIKSVCVVFLIASFVLPAMAFAEPDNSQNKLPYHYKYLPMKEVLDARLNGQNIYQNYLPDFDSIPEEKILEVAKEFNRLYTEEQEIVNSIQMKPKADSELANDDFDTIEIRSSLYYIPLGQNRNLGMSFGNINGNRGGWMAHTSRWETQHNCRMRTFNSATLIGNAWSWVIMERRFWITGTGRQWGSINLGPIDYNMRLSAIPDTSAYIRLRAELCDVTSSPVELLKRNVILNQTLSPSPSSPFNRDFNGRYNQHIYHEFRAGRTYVVRLVQEGGASASTDLGGARQDYFDWTRKDSNIHIQWYNW